MLGIARRIDSVSEWIGRAVSWLALLLVLLTFTIVVLRYLFNLGAVALQELLLYLHSLIFLMGAAYTLKHDGHVRVDMFYRPMTPRKKAWVNLLGSVFLLLPCCVFIFWISWQYVTDSWSYFEGSREAGGLDAVYLLKTLLLIAPAALILQAIAESLRACCLIRGIEIPAEDNG